MSFSCLSLFVLLIFSLMSKVFVLLSYFYYKMYGHKFHPIPPESGPSMTGKNYLMIGITLGKYMEFLAIHQIRTSLKISLFDRRLFVISSIFFNLGVFCLLFWYVFYV